MLPKFDLQATIEVADRDLESSRVLLERLGPVGNRESRAVRDIIDSKTNVLVDGGEGFCEVRVSQA